MKKIWYEANRSETNMIWSKYSKWYEANINHTCLIHAVCPSPCCMPISMLQSMSGLHVYVSAACSSPCRTDKDMQHGHRHAAWTWTCTIKWTHTLSTEMGMQYGHRHAAWRSTCCLSMFMFMLHVHVHAACLCSCCMSMSMLDVIVHTACPSSCCVSFPCWCQCLCCMSCPCCMSMSVLHGLEQQHGQGRTCSMEMRGEGGSEYPCPLWIGGREKCVNGKFNPNIHGPLSIQALGFKTWSLVGSRICHAGLKEVKVRLF